MRLISEGGNCSASPCRPKRVGIFGGTFNPPHNGHVHAAREFLSEMDLDELLIIPAYIPPHKSINDEGGPSARLDMCRAAFPEISEKVTVSDYEIKKCGISYTYSTLTHFAKKGIKLFFLCGTDMFLTVDSWKKPEVLFKKAAFVCAMRDSDRESCDKVKAYADIYRAKYGAEVYLLASKAVEMSSSSIRNAVAEGGDISEMVPEGVSEIINARGLYRR